MTPVVDAFMQDAPVRRPGDFRRARNGTPYVSHPDGQLTKPKSKKDPGHIIWVPCSRPSGFSKIIEDYYAIAKWTERQEALGFAIDPWNLIPQALTLLVDDRDTEEWRANADSVVAAAKRAAKAGIAADRGTHAHQLTEDDDEGRDIITRIEAGEELGLDVAVQRSLVDAWRAMLERDGIEILAVEMPVVNDTYRAAGTLDRVGRLTKPLRFSLVNGEIIELPAGTVPIVDIKSGKRRLRNNGTVMYWHGYAVQVFLYANGVPYNTDTDTRGKWEWEIDQRYALIAHLDVLGALDGVPSCELILVDIEAGRHAADLCVAAKAWEARIDVFSVTQLTVEGEGSSEAAEGIDTPPSPSTPVSPQATQSPATVNAGGVGSSADQPLHPPAAEWQTNTNLQLREKALMVPIYEPTAFIDDPPKPEALAWASQPAPTPLAPLPDHPDEGRSAGRPDRFEDLKVEYNEMPADTRAWIAGLVRQAQQAGVGFHTQGNQTERRYWIIRGIVTLTQDGNSGHDDVLRALCVAALGIDAPLDARHTAGACVGSLDAAAAQRFAALVADYVGTTV